MAITWYALLLRPAKIRSPSDGMVARCFGPVRHPLKMIFCFGKRAVAGVDGEGVAKVEPAIAIHIEGWHPACVARAQVQAGDPRITSRCRIGPTRLYPDEIPVCSKAHLGNQGGTQALGITERQALVARV